jgi:hypothetical protein
MSRQAWWGAAALALIVWTLPAWAEQAVEEPKDEPKPEEKKAGGPPGRGGPRAFPGAPGAGGRNPVEMMRSIAGRSLGEDRPIKIEDLPFGSDRHLLRMAVGSVDNLQDYRPGLKVEDLFALTDEQKKALEELRKAYGEERDKFQKELEEFHKSLVARVKEVRQKYEVQANDVLAGELKTSKEKLDAIVKEYNEKRGEGAKGIKEKLDAAQADLEKAMAAAREAQNWDGVRQAMEKHRDALRPIQDRADVDLDAVKEKMKAAVTGEARTKLEEALKRPEFRPMWRPGGGRGGGAPGKAEPKAAPGEF